MKRVFIIHGWDGHPDEGWFPWLKSQLEKVDFVVSVPAMPEPETPKIKSWVEHIRQEVGRVDQNTYLIGHSIGCQAILRYVESLSNEEMRGNKIAGVVLVAGWIHRLDGDLSPAEIAIAKPWVETPIDLAKIKARCKKITAIFSNNDIWVRLTDENRKIFAEQLGAKIILEHNKGHFNDESGIKELPSALEAILNG